MYIHLHWGFFFGGGYGVQLSHYLSTIVFSNNADMAQIGLDQQTRRPRVTANVKWKIPFLAQRQQDQKFATLYRQWFFVHISMLNFRAGCLTVLSLGCV